MDNFEFVQNNWATPELKYKLVEEANEFKSTRTDDQNIEELADVLEIIRGMCKLYDLGLDDLNELRMKDAKKR